MYGGPKWKPGGATLIKGVGEITTALLQLLKPVDVILHYLNTAFMQENTDYILYVDHVYAKRTVLPSFLLQLSL